MPIIGIDDTDSAREMCTTYITIEILKRTSLDLIGFPRLVRLNPNIPLKTRGNAAISITLGRGMGSKQEVGKIDGETVHSYERFEEAKLDIDLMSIIEEFSPRDEKTNPAVIVTGERENENFYWEAVREFVDYREVKGRIGGEIETINGDVGIVGANAANSWPEKHATYELISYLKKERWGGNHFVSPIGAEYLERNFPDTFDNFDFANNYNAIRPTTKTPVLFGIRGIDHVNLHRTLEYIESEPYDSYIIYKTNQGTDDHLVRRTISGTRLYDSSIIDGVVASNPVMIRGGVAIFDFSDGSGSIKAVAMQPTKEFRETVTKLRRGDRLRLFGGITKEGYINLEKFKVLSLSNVLEIEPPVCLNCNIKMESVGKGKGYRCRKCGKRGEGEAKDASRDIAAETYEVPIVARRHLSRPLKLGVIA